MNTRHVLSTLIISLLSGVTLFEAAHAQQLDSYDSLFKVVLESSLNTQTTAPGDRVEAVLAEPNCYQQTCLPAGTKVMGVVTEVKAGKAFSLNPAIFLHVNQVKFPNGVVTQLPVDTQKSRLYDEHQVQQGNAGKEYTAVSLASTAVGFVNPLAGVATRVAAGSAVGVGTEQSGSTVEKAASGVYQSTAIPKVLNFVNDKPVLEYTPGETVYFKLSTTGAQTVFDAYRQNEAGQSSLY